MLRAQGICKAYKNNVVLENVDVSLEPKTITALIGPSGSGKSTLIRSLSLLEEPDRGSLSIDGVQYTFPPSATANPAPIWPAVTVVFQQLFLWPHLTLRQNIELPLKSLDPENATRNVKAIVDEVGIGGFVDRCPNEVSIGQRQLAAIARALALRPRYLLLDEITSALDVEHVSKILNIVKSRKDDGAGILIVTHYINFARNSADQVMFIDDRRIIESGGPEILDKPNTDRLARFLSLALAAR